MDSPISGRSKENPDSSPLSSYSRTGFPRASTTSGLRGQESPSLGSHGRRGKSGRSPNPCMPAVLIVRHEHVLASSSCHEAGATPFYFHYQGPRASTRTQIALQCRLPRPSWYSLTAILSRFCPALDSTIHSPGVKAAMTVVARLFRNIDAAAAAMLLRKGIPMCMSVLGQCRSL